jgi:hypothetical protein
VAINIHWLLLQERSLLKPSDATLKGTVFIHAGKLGGK